MKSLLHAKSSVSIFGGCIEDYLPIHTWFDTSKNYYPDVRHRALRHHSEGIGMCESIFGGYITNSDGKQVSVRAIGEQHCREDLGFIPTVEFWLSKIGMEPWMYGLVRRDQPDMRKSIIRRKLLVREKETQDE